MNCGNENCCSGDKCLVLETLEAVNQKLTELAERTKDVDVEATKALLIQEKLKEIHLTSQLLCGKFCKSTDSCCNGTCK